MKIMVQIERMVLDGLQITAAEGQQIGRSVEREIGRLMAAAEPPHLVDGAVPAVTAPPIYLQGNEPPAVIGARIARSLYGAIPGADRYDRR